MVIEEKLKQITVNLRKDLIRNKEKKNNISMQAFLMLQEWNHEFNIFTLPWDVMVCFNAIISAR